MQVGDEFRRDRHARLVLAILSGVPEKRDDRRDARRAGPAAGINHDQQFHQMLVGRRRGRLDNEDIAAADVFVDL